MKLSLFLLVHSQGQENKQALVEGVRGACTAEGSVALQLGQSILGLELFLPSLAALGALAQPAQAKQLNWGSYTPSGGLLF